MLAALLTATPASGQAPTDTWISTTSGNWSDGARWLGGTPPPFGGGASRVLHFTVDGSSYTATNNLGNPFVLNGLMFEGVGTGTVTLANAAGNSLSLNGASPFVLQNATAPAVISANLALAAATTVGGTGTAPLTFSGVLSGGTGANTTALMINQTGTFPAPDGTVGGGGLVTLSGANAFAGDVALVGGNIALGNAAAVGGAANRLLIGNSATTLRFASAGLTIANQIVATGDLSIVGPNVGTLSGAITGTGGVSILGGGPGSGAVTLSAADGYTGATTVGRPGVGSNSALTLSGQGSIPSTSAVIVNSEASLSVINTANAVSLNRVSDAAPLALRNGRLNYTAAPGLAGGETFGPVTASGHSILTATAGTTSGSSSVLNFGPLSRHDNGTLLVRPPNGTTQSVGGGAPGPNRTNVFFAGGLPTIADPLGPAGGPNVLVVPFVAGDFNVTTSNVASTLATYDANGLTLLNPNNPAHFAQVTDSSAALVPGVNNRLVATSIRVDNTVHINSLVTSGSLTGTGTLQVISGATVLSGGADFQGPMVAFGGTTGYFYTNALSSLEGASSVTGTAGVVVSSASGGGLQLFTDGPNPFRGGLFINGSATVYFRRDDQVGAAGEGITLNGGTLVHLGTGALDAARTIRLGPAGGTLSDTFPGPFTVPGVITGPGGLTSTGNLVLTGSNSYSGPTVVSSGVLVLADSNSGGGATIVNQGGTLEFAGDSNLASGPVILNGGFLRPPPNVTVTRNVTVFADFSRIAVDPGATATLAGALRGDADLILQGGGTLSLTGVSPPASTVRVDAGSLVLTGAGALPRATAIWAGVPVTGRSLVRLDNSAGAADRLGPTTRVVLDHGAEFRLDGGAGPTEETFGTLALGTQRLGTGTVTVVPGSGTTATLRAAGYSQSSAALFRGTNLGGTGVPSAHVFLGGVADGSLLVNALTDTDPAGGGREQAFYSAATGVRPATPADYVTSSFLQNAAPTNTPTTANFRVSAAVATADSANTVRSLRFEPGSALDASSGTLNLSAGYIFVAPGGLASTTGGVIASSSISRGLNVLTLGDLTVNSQLSADSFSKYGPGTLRLTGPAAPSGRIVVDNGALVLDNGLVNSVTDVAGTGNVVLNSATTNLRVTTALSTSIDALLSGPGGLTFDPSALSLMTLTRSNTHSGGTVGSAAATFRLENPAGFGTGPAVLANDGGTATPRTLITFGFGSGTVANDIRLPAENAASEFLLTDASDSVPLTGRMRGGNGAAGTVIRFRGQGNILPNGGFALANPNNDFTARVVVNGVRLGVTSNAALGNPGNAVDLDGSGLRFDAEGVILTRPITSLTIGSTATVDTQGHAAQLSGPVGGPGNFTKIGDGTLALSAANTVTGTVSVSQGTLIVNGSVAPGANGNSLIAFPVSVLAGTGTINRAMTTRTGSTLAPGTPTATGRLTVADLVDLSGTFAVRLNGAAPGDGTSMAGYDQLAATGLVLLGATLSASVGAGFDPTTANTPLFIVDNRSSTLTGTTFTGLPDGAVVNLGAYTARISYFGNVATGAVTGGNDVVLYSFQPVPEPPGILAFGAIAGLITVTCARQKSYKWVAAL